MNISLTRAPKIGLLHTNCHEWEQISSWDTIRTLYEELRSSTPARFFTASAIFIFPIFQIPKNVGICGRRQEIEKGLASRFPFIGGQDLSGESYRSGRLEGKLSLTLCIVRFAERAELALPYATSTPLNTQIGIA